MKERSFTIRRLFLQDLTDHLLDHFIRLEETTHILVLRGGELFEESSPWLDDWDDADRKDQLHHLQNAAAAGAVFGAFEQGELIGFSSIALPFLGEEQEMLELQKLHVSAPARGMGVGSALFQAAAQQAGRMGAKSLYISSHPGVKAQAFYRRMGCRLSPRFIAAPAGMRWISPCSTTCRLPHKKRRILNSLLL